MFFAGCPKADSHDLDNGTECTLRSFEDNARLEVVGDTAAGRAAVWGDVSGLEEWAERNHMRWWQMQVLPLAGVEQAPAPAQAGKWQGSNFAKEDLVHKAEYESASSP